MTIAVGARAIAGPRRDGRSAVRRCLVRISRIGVCGIMAALRTQLPAAAGSGPCIALADARERWSAELSASADRPFAELVAELAERSPAPGAGSAVAWSGALAAGLLEMVSAYAGLDQIRARATLLRGELLEAAERELHAYEPVLAASSEQERTEALSAASDVPVAIARASSEVAELGAQVVKQSKPALKGDAIAGVLLAEASARAAAQLVEINLSAAQSDLRLSEVARMCERAADARDGALRGA